MKSVLDNLFKSIVIQGNRYCEGDKFMNTNGSIGTFISINETGKIVFELSNVIQECQHTAIWVPIYPVIP